LFDQIAAQRGDSAVVLPFPSLSSHLSSNAACRRRRASIDRRNGTFRLDLASLRVRIPEQPL
jgi:hypothetical protein